MCSQWTSKQRIRLNLPISAFYPHFSVLSPFQRFIPISACYPHFSVLSPFQRFIPISVSAFSFRFRDSVSAFYPYPLHRAVCTFPRIMDTARGGSKYIQTRHSRFINDFFPSMLSLNVYAPVDRMHESRRIKNYETTSTVLVLLT